MTGSAPSATWDGAGPAERAPRPRRPIDAVGVLTLFLVVLFVVPGPLIFKPLGSAGTPANLFGLALLFWWVVAKVGTGLGVDRRHQPVRVALLIYLLAILTSMTAMFLRPYTGEESLGGYRGLIFLGAMFGIALVAADGISTLERVHVLMRRVVLGVSLVAAGGLLEFLTGYAPARMLMIPGLTRNQELFEQGRSSFVRVQSTTLHPIELGALLGFVLPVAVHYGFHSKPGRQRTLAWVQVGLIAAVIPMALSRTGVIACAVGLLVLSFDWTWRQRGRVIVVGALGLVVLRFTIPGLVGSLTALFTKFGEDTSTQVRQQRYDIFGKYFLQHPVFGRGNNTLYPVTHQVFDNQYLYAATEMGAVGVIATLLLLIIPIFIARGARLRSTDPQTRGLAQALTGGFAAMVIMFATADMLQFGMLMGVYFLFVGVAGALWRLTGGNTSARAVVQQVRVTLPRV